MSHGWTSPALIGALLLSSSLHAVPVVKAIRDLVEARSFLKEARATVHDYLWTQYEVEVEKEKPKPEEPKKEEPAPEPAPAPKPVVMKAPAEKPPEQAPSPATAGKTLTANADPNAPVDFSDFTMVQGEGTSYAGGITAKDGKSKSAVTTAPVADGKPDGKGTASAAPPPPPPEGPDLSRPATTARKDWKCPFPPEADADDVNNAVVSVIVTVRPDGSPASVKVVADPGHGFGRAARMCALARKYNAGKDAEGNLTTKSTPPIRVTFSR